MPRGIDVLEDHAGSGAPARRGDLVVFTWRVWLNRGDEVPINEQQASRLPATLLRTEDGRTLVDHKIRLGRREAVPGVEQPLIGMQVGGRRRVRVKPHLGFRDRGVPGLIPPGAVVEIELCLRSIHPPSGPSG